MAFVVMQPGLYTLPAGRPRPVTRHLGVPVGGPADVESCQRANAFLGNSPDATALEVTLMGPKLQALEPTVAVVFGAALEMKSSRGQTLEVGRSFRLEQLDVLTVGGCASGCRAYLAVCGGFRFPEILGSETGIAPIQRGDRLLVGRVDSSEPASWPIEDRRVPIRSASVSLTPLPGVLRCLLGPQFNWFPDSKFFNQMYTVSPKIDRMGLRLQGEPILRRPGELVSEPVSPGAVQITNDGLPVILGVDGQTIGGYPKIAHVIRADLDALGQLRPGDSIRFQSVTLAEARENERKQIAARRQLFAMWNLAAKSPNW